MKKNRKKYFLTSALIIICLFLIANFCFAVGRELELQYPTVPGAEAPTTTKTVLSQYVKYLFNFSIIIAGIIAFGVIIFGGVKWLTSAGSPAQASDAKDQALAGILGLVVLLSSYLILTTINPQLVIFDVGKAGLGQGITLWDNQNNEITFGESQSDLLDFNAVRYQILDTNNFPDNLEIYVYSGKGMQGTKTALTTNEGSLSSPKSLEIIWKLPGVYLCKDATKKECVYFGHSSAAFREDIDNKMTYYYFKNPPTGIKYGAVIHEDKSYLGTCKFLSSEGFTEGSISLPTGQPSSITIFTLADSPMGKGITLFEAKDYNRECGESCYQECPGSGNECGSNCITILWPKKRGGKCWGPFQNVQNPNLGASSPTGAFGLSIEVNGGGEYLAALFEGRNYSGRCEVFTQNDPLLKDNYIGTCGLFNNLGCFNSLIVVPIEAKL